MKNKLLIIIDGNYLFYRAFYSTSWMGDYENNAVYGFNQTLKLFNRTLKPSKIIIAFDSKGDTFRKKLDTAYKAHREGMPDELAMQIKPLHELLINQKIEFFAKPGIEGDDIVGILATKHHKKYNQVFIVTSDKDMNQLIRDNIYIYRYIKKQWTIVDANAIKTRYGIEPNQFIDYLALVGDTADNIPKGIPKIGPKTAVKLMNQYNTLENIYKQPQFKQHTNRLKLNKKLVTILTK